MSSPSRRENRRCWKGTCTRCHERWIRATSSTSTVPVRPVLAEGAAGREPSRELGRIRSRPGPGSASFGNTPLETPM